VHGLRHRLVQPGAVEGAFQVRHEREHGQEDLSVSSASALPAGPALRLSSGHGLVGLAHPQPPAVDGQAVEVLDRQPGMDRAVIAPPDAAAILSSGRTVRPFPNCRSLRRSPGGFFVQCRRRADAMGGSLLLGRFRLGGKRDRLFSCPLGMNPCRPGSEGAGGKAFFKQCTVSWMVSSPSYVNSTGNLVRILALPASGSVTGKAGVGSTAATRYDLSQRRFHYDFSQS
jgi:hypothetical protein